MTTKTKIIIYIAFLIFLFPKPAHAYLDPGTGSYLFQLLIASLLGGSFFMKGNLQKIIEKIKNRGKKESENKKETKVKDDKEK